MVIKEILDGKKPKSRVDGDVFADVLAKNVTKLAPTIAKIFTKVIDSGVWPDQWLKEHVRAVS